MVDVVVKYQKASIRAVVLVKALLNVKFEKSHHIIKSAVL